MRKEEILAMSVDLAKTHLLNNQMDPAEIPEFIQKIHATLLALHSAGQGDMAIENVRLLEVPSDPKIAGVINDDISGEEFEGLDPWLAKRVAPRVARKLNRNGNGHPSIFDDYLICLEDGQEVKLLRPYVQKRFGLTFAEYLDKWNLPDDYPIAPATYTRRKRDMAQKAGLGSTLRGKRGKAKGKASHEAS